MSHSSASLTWPLLFLEVFPYLKNITKTYHPSIIWIRRLGQPVLLFFWNCLKLTFCSKWGRLYYFSLLFSSLFDALQ